jgi:parallel beta-helix repeat protein
VSSEIGSNNNAGTSATAPLATLQAAADLVRPGDTVEVMNGTYTGPQGGDVVDITTSGTASAPITFEAAPGQTPVINSAGCWNAIKIEASYIVVNGFTVVGDAANYTLSQALAGYSTGSANLDAAGINITGTPGVNVPNHITIENNTVYNEPGGGIGSGYADYLNILNNVVYDNAHWSAFGNSGISIWESANSDTNSGVHDIISGNLVYGNAQLVPTNGVGTITDGEGIILDTNTGFVGEILVENNTVYGNGSAGIESFRTNGAVITENTVYGNNTANVLQTASDDEIFINQSNNDTVTNNITTAPNLTSPTISSLTESPSSGDLDAAKTVTLTLNLSEAVTGYRSRRYRATSPRCQAVRLQAPQLSHRYCGASLFMPPLHRATTMPAGGLLGRSVSRRRHGLSPFNALPALFMPRCPRPIANEIHLPLRLTGVSPTPTAIL